MAYESSHFETCCELCNNIISKKIIQSTFLCVFGHNIGKPIYKYHQTWLLNLHVEACIFQCERPFNYKSEAIIIILIYFKSKFLVLGKFQCIFLLNISFDDLFFQSLLCHFLSPWCKFFLFMTNNGIISKVHYESPFLFDFIHNFQNDFH